VQIGSHPDGRIPIEFRYVADVVDGEARVLAAEQLDVGEVAERSALGTGLAVVEPDVDAAIGRASLPAG
jgi:hypothetical protein